MEGRPAVFILMTLLQIKALLEPSSAHLDEECCLQTGDHSSSFNFSTADADLSSTIVMGGGEGGDGLLVLIPGMSFGCHGSISSWSGVVSVSTDDALSESFQMFLQVWRPMQEGCYGLIGSHSLTFNSTDFSWPWPSQVQGAKVDNTMEYQRKRYYQFIEKEGQSSLDYGVPFQPRDIIGCFIPSVSSAAGLVNSSLGSLELVFRNTSPGDESEACLIVFDGIKGEPYEVPSCKASPRNIPSVVPLIHPHCKAWGSGSGSAFETPGSTFPIAPVLCEVSNTSCTAGRPSMAVTGLFAVIAGVCIAAACIVSITANVVTFCMARRRLQRRKRKREARKGKRIEASCPFITNQLAGQQSEEQPSPNERPISNITSLADFLQYSMQITDELESETNRMSWV